MTKAKKSYFRKWDWEFDFGVDEISSESLPETYAQVWIDYWGRLFRVDYYENKRNCASIDYYCDEAGRIFEKRSVDFSAGGMVCLVVRYTYDFSTNRLTESASSPDSTDVPTSIDRERQ